MNEENNKIQEILKEIQNNLDESIYISKIENHRNQLLLKSKRFSRIIIMISAFGYEYEDTVTVTIQLTNQVGYYNFKISEVENYVSEVNKFLINLETQIVKFLGFTHEIIKNFDIDEDDTDIYSYIIDLNDINLFITNKSKNKSIVIHSSFEFDPFLDYQIKAVGYVNSVDIPNSIKVHTTENPSKVMDIINFLI